MAERYYFYSAFLQQGVGVLRYYSGVTGIDIDYTSSAFLPAVLHRIAEQAKDPSIHDKLVIQALTPLDPPSRGGDYDGAAS